MAKRETPLGIRDQPTVRKGRIKQSRRVLRRIETAGMLRGSINKIKAKAAAGFRQRFAEDLQNGEAPPDQTLALELAGRSVMRAIDYLSRADEVYCGQSVRRKHLNQACTEVARWEIYPELVDVRRSIDAAFGRIKGQYLHEMKGKTRRKPERLVPQLARLVKNLKDPRLTLPTPLRPTSRVDPEGWLKQLEPGYLKLKAMLEQLESEERKEHRRREERDYELECFDIIYSEALTFVRSVFCLGGVSDRETWNLLPNIQRRRLRSKARQEREARVEGLREPEDSSDSDDSHDTGADASSERGPRARGPGARGPVNVA